MTFFTISFHLFNIFFQSIRVITLLRMIYLFCFVFNWGDAPSLSRRAPNEGAKSIPKDHVIDLCDINASLLPRPGIEPGPAAWQARTLALHHVSGLAFPVIEDFSSQVVQCRRVGMIRF